MARDWTGLLKATLFTGVLFAIGLGVRELGFDDPSIGIFTLLTVAFLIIFAVTSGRLASLDGPGGMKASFHDFLEKDSSRFPSSEVGEPVSSESLWMMRKGSPEELTDEMRSIAPGKHAALVLQEGLNYEPELIHDYEKAALRISKSITPIIIDQRGRFVGSLTPRTQGRPPMRHRRAFEELIASLSKSPDSRPLAEHRMLNVVSFPSSLTLREALEYFVSSEKDYLVVVDAKNRPTRIVFKEDLLAELLSFVRSVE